MGSGADGKKVSKATNRKKPNIKTLDQKPPEKKADFDINKDSKKEEIGHTGVWVDDKPPCVCAESVGDLLKDLKALQDKHSNAFCHDGNDAHPLEICKKTLQRLIDRVKAVGV
jgi:hypothetical protein